MSRHVQYTLFIECAGTPEIRVMLSPDGKLEVAVPLSGKDLACQPSVTTINIKQEVMENVSQLAVAPNPSSLKRFIDRMKEVTSGIKALETIAQWVCLLLAP